MRPTNRVSPTWLIAPGATLAGGAAAGIAWVLARDGLGPASAGSAMPGLVAVLGAAATLLLLGGSWGHARRPGGAGPADRAVRRYTGALVGGTCCAAAAIALTIPVGLARAFP